MSVARAVVTGDENLLASDCQKYEPKPDHHMKMTYTDEHARAGVNAPLPKIETWPNQYPDYEIEIQIPEFTSVCPKTGLPDFGKLTLIYTPHRKCLELKSLKMYTLAYRNLGIFYENVVNRFLRDIVKAADPVRATVVGEFTPRGGLQSRITARWDRKAETRDERRAATNERGRDKMPETTGKGQEARGKRREMK